MDIYIYIMIIEEFLLSINLHRSNASSEGNAILKVSKHLRICGGGIPSFRVMPKDASSLTRRYWETFIIHKFKPALNA